ncbi:ABC transporter ATP-binding protein [Moorena bouillonii]|uniref:ABC transporter ATP-binding protein n=1 Tax=Moorena bouillonii PNG TaxID=568701 RepID=A0A1U7MYD2_9CYAN|nr:ABC transporter ATP-binding protein [Moorena bouillonii]OLT58706.1 ABC transporter ATP-binding protein [Moorena bouillonii PNG]
MSPNRLLLSYALRHPTWIVLTVLLGFSSAMFNSVGTTIIVPLVLEFLGQKKLELSKAPPIIQKTMGLFEGFEGGDRLLIMVLVVLLAIVLKNVANYVNILVSTHLSKKLINTFRKEGIKLLLDVDLDFYAKTKIGDIINRISQEIGRGANAIKLAIQLFTTVITIFVFVFLLISISWQLTIATSILLLGVFVINQFFVKRSKEFGKVLSEKSRGYSGALLEILTGIRLIKSVSSEQDEYQRIEKFIDEREQAEFQSQANFAAINPINEVSGILAILAIVFVGKNLLLKDSSAEELEAISTVLGIYLFLLFRLLPVISQLNGQRSRFANVSASTAIVADFLRRDNKPIMSNGKNIYTKLSQEIRIENLSFAYPGHQDSVLNGVNLSIPKGTTMALVGASGAGKSTLADLLPRFYDPVEGRITIDGTDLKDYDISSLRQAMGVVSQDTFLFNNSVRNNIAYGMKDVTEADIIAAAKRANAYEFIMQLPQGFDTKVGDRGVMLSGGQRQRMAIARALLRNPDILILDEATSALDTVSERLVQQAIDELCRDRTTVVIAHRLSTIQKAHQIVVMEKGQVVEIGTHEELLKKEGYYSRLYKMQFEHNSNGEVKNVVKKELIKTSHEVRTHLTPMIVCLQLVVNDLVDSPQERQELTEEAYHSAVRLLKTLEYLEESSAIKSIA